MSVLYDPSLLAGAVHGVLRWSSEKLRSSESTLAYLGLHRNAHNDRDTRRLYSYPSERGSCILNAAPEEYTCWETDRDTWRLYSYLSERGSWSSYHSERGSWRIHMLKNEPPPPKKGIDLLLCQIDSTDCRPPPAPPATNVGGCSGKCVIALDAPTHLLNIGYGGGGLPGQYLFSESTVRFTIRTRFFNTKAAQKNWGAPRPIPFFRRVLSDSQCGRGSSIRKRHNIFVSTE